MGENNNMTNREDVLKDLPSSYKERFKEEKEYLKKKIEKNSNVLEIWCWDWRSISDIIHITQNITWIDHDQYAVDQANKKFKDYKNIKIIKADAESLPFEDKEFDNIICMTSFANFWEKKDIIIQEAKRVLKNDGKVIISVFSEEALWERLEIYKKFESENKLKILEVLNNWTVKFEWPDKENNLSDNISEQFNWSQIRDIFIKNWFSEENITKIKSKIAYLCTFRNI